MVLFFPVGGGACTGSGGCSVTLSSDLNVTAIFQQESSENFTLMVETSIGGTIFSSLDGLIAALKWYYLHRISRIASKFLTS